MVVACVLRPQPWWCCPQALQLLCVHAQPWPCPAPFGGHLTLIRSRASHGSTFANFIRRGMASTAEGCAVLQPQPCWSWATTDGQGISCRCRTFE